MDGEEEIITCNADRAVIDIRKLLKSNFCVIKWIRNLMDTELSIKVNGQEIICISAKSFENMDDFPFYALFFSQVFLTCYNSFLNLRFCVKYVDFSSEKKELYWRNTRRVGCGMISRVAIDMDDGDFVLLLRKNK